MFTLTGKTRINMKLNSPLLFLAALPSIFSLPNPNICDERITNNGLKIQILIECAVQSIDGADRGIDCFNASEMVALDSAPCEDIRFKITYKMFNKCEDPVSGSNPKNFNQESGYNVAINLNHNKLTVDGVEVGQVETEEKQMIPMFQNAKVRHYIDANSCNNKDYDVSADFRAKRIVGNDKWNIGCATSRTISLKGSPSGPGFDKFPPSSTPKGKGTRAPSEGKGTRSPSVGGTKAPSANDRKRMRRTRRS